MEEMLKLGCTDQEGAQWAVTNVWNLCGKGAFRGEEPSIMVAHVVR